MSNTIINFPTSSRFSPRINQGHINEAAQWETLAATSGCLINDLTGDGDWISTREDGAEFLTIDRHWQPSDYVILVGGRWCLEREGQPLEWFSTIRAALEAIFPTLPPTINDAILSNVTPFRPVHAGR
jgi:hypothetical protein